MCSWKTFYFVCACEDEHYHRPYCRCNCPLDDVIVLFVIRRPPSPPLPPPLIEAFHTSGQSHKQTEQQQTMRNLGCADHSGVAAGGYTTTDPKPTILNTKSFNKCEQGSLSPIRGS